MLSEHRLKFAVVTSQVPTNCASPTGPAFASTHVGNACPQLPPEVVETLLETSASVLETPVDRGTMLPPVLVAVPGLEPPATPSLVSSQATK